MSCEQFPANQLILNNRTLKYSCYAQLEHYNESNTRSGNEGAERIEGTMPLTPTGTYGYGQVK